MLWLFPWFCLFVLIALFYLLIYKASTSKSSLRTRVISLTPSAAALELPALCLTWNTADHLPLSSELETVLPKTDLARHDIVAIALQECPAGGWLHTLSMHCGHDFTLVASESSRRCIHLAVYLRSKLLGDLANVQTASETFGLPVFFRKGGVGVCFTLKSRRLLFMSAHLSAHEGQVYARNTDALALFYRLSIGCSAADLNLPLLRRFDSAFLMGDLNYRLASIPRAAAYDRLSVPEAQLPVSLAALADHDELSIEMKRPQGVYKGWREQPISFAPTYKFITKDAPSPYVYDVIIECLIVALFSLFLSHALSRTSMSVAEFLSLSLSNLSLFDINLT